MADKKIRFVITRQEGPDAAPYQEELFALDYRPNMNVISALMEIRRKPGQCERGRHDTDQLDMNCLEEVCGACSMVINGKPRQSCTALIDQLEQPIRLEPMRTFRSYATCRWTAAGCSTAEESESLDPDRWYV